MNSSSNYDFCIEAYEVVKTIILDVEIAGEERSIKIEVLHSMKGGHYCSRAYIKENVTLQSNYLQTDTTPIDMDVWVSYDLPWTHLDSAEMVINESISFLRERCG